MGPAPWRGRRFIFIKTSTSAGGRLPAPQPALLPLALQGHGSREARSHTGCHLGRQVWVALRAGGSKRDSEENKQRVHGQHCPG